jgi:hypothetical protein
MSFIWSRIVSGITAILIALGISTAPVPEPLVSDVFQQQTFIESVQKSEEIVQGYDVLSKTIKDHKGAWFKISYPVNFIAKMEGTINYSGNSDEASFTSPDASVQFYVYSPLWGGNPVSYLKALPMETIESDISTSSVSSFTNKYGTISDKKVTRWVTFADKNGSYKRSFVSIKSGVFDQPDKYDNDAQFHHVFGIKYKDDATYNQYLDDYLAFKKSLVQYAD